MQEHSEPLVPAEAAAPMPPAANDSVPAPEALSLVFTGSGKEYFRIWIVNLFLTVATLGIYSAWAKVRRLQYFDRNTRLGCAAFDFRGDPKAILKGRVLALCLAAGYHYAFGFSVTIGAAMAVLLLLALPFFLRSALRFRLHNTTYRGLHFDFSGTIGGAYLAYLPPLLTLLLPGALVALDPSGLMAALAFLLYLGWPLMFGIMKRYQQRHLQYGAVGSAYHVAPLRFFKPYLIGIGIALGGGLVLALFVGIVLAMVSTMAGSESSLPSIIASMVTGYAALLLIFPYIQARIANLVWSNTSFPGVEIRCTMSAWDFIKLQTANTLLTIVTLGLYRPFAVVRVYEYRLAQVSLHSTESFEQVVAGAARRPGGAAGDGMADFLGVDISW